MTPEDKITFRERISKGFQSFRNPNSSISYPSALELAKETEVLHSIIDEFTKQSKVLTPSSSAGDIWEDTPETTIRLPRVPFDLTLFYLIRWESAVLRSVTNTITQEIFRETLKEGWLFKPKFRVKCSKCHREFSEKVDQCPYCKGGTFPPDPEQQRVWNKLTKNSNSAKQSFLTVCHEMNLDLETIDDLFLVVKKEYMVSDTSDLVFGKVRELMRGDPITFRFISDGQGKRGDLYWICPVHRDFVSESSGTCEVYNNDTGKRCNVKLRDPHFVELERGGTSPVAFYFEDEVIHASKYEPSRLYGFSPVYTLWVLVRTLILMDAYVQQAYSKGRLRGILGINAHWDYVKKWWDEVQMRLRKDPHYQPVIALEGEDGGSGTKRMEFVKFMDSLQEMQYTGAQEIIRRQIGAMWGVSPIFQNDTSTGTGLNNEGLQITVTDRAVDFGQSVWHSEVFPHLCDMLGITDWHVELRSSREIDAMSDLQQFHQKAETARVIQELGFTVELIEDDSGIGGFKFTGEAQTAQQQQFAQNYSQFGQGQLPAGSQDQDQDQQRPQTEEPANRQGFKNCPPGQIATPKNPKCHPIEWESNKSSGFIKGSQEDKVLQIMIDANKDVSFHKQKVKHHEHTMNNLKGAYSETQDPDKRHSYLKEMRRVEHKLNDHKKKLRDAQHDLDRSKREYNRLSSQKSSFTSASPNYFNPIYEDEKSNSYLIVKVRDSTFQQELKEAQDPNHEMFWTLNKVKVIGKSSEAKKIYFETNKGIQGSFDITGYGNRVYKGENQPVVFFDRNFDKSIEKSECSGRPPTREGYFPYYCREVEIEYQFYMDEKGQLWFIGATDKQGKNIGKWIAVGEVKRTWGWYGVNLKDGRHKGWHKDEIKGSAPYHLKNLSEDKLADMTASAFSGKVFDIAEWKDYSLLKKIEGMLKRANSEKWFELGTKKYYMNAAWRIYEEESKSIHPEDEEEEGHRRFPYIYAEEANKAEGTRTFDMIRNKDESGVSGTGHVGSGVVFPDGETVFRWLTDDSSTTVYDSFEKFKAIHIDNHPSNETEIKWHDNKDEKKANKEKMYCLDCKEQTTHEFVHTDYITRLSIPAEIWKCLKCGKKSKMTSVKEEKDSKPEDCNCTDEKKTIEPKKEVIEDREQIESKFVDQVTSPYFSSFDSLDKLKDKSQKAIIGEVEKLISNNRAKLEKIAFSEVLGAYREGKESVQDVAKMSAAFSTSGGKARMARRLKSVIPIHKVYNEPFAGAGSVFLTKDNAAQSYLNDFDKDVIMIWKTLQDGGEEAFKALSQKQWNADKSHWTKLKSIDPKPLSQLERAYRKIYLRRYSNMSKEEGFRSDNKDLGAPRWLRKPGSFHKYTEKLKGVNISIGDWKDITRKVDSPNTFHFIDPPYDESFAKELCKVLPTLKGKYLVTFGECSILRKFFKEQVHEIKVKSNSNFWNVPKDSHRKELLITNYKINVPQGTVFKSDTKPSEISFEDLPFSKADIQVLEAIYKENPFWNAFSGLSESLGDKLKSIITDSYLPPTSSEFKAALKEVKAKYPEYDLDIQRQVAYMRVGKFDLARTIKEMKKVVGDEFYRLERIARTETTAISNKGREMAWVERDPEDEFKYDWIGPNDGRTSDECRSIKEITYREGKGFGVSLDRLKTIQKDVVEEENRGKKSDFKYRDWVPHINCRHVLRRIA